MLLLFSMLSTLQSSTILPQIKTIKIDAHHPHINANNYLLYIRLKSNIFLCFNKSVYYYSNQFSNIKSMKLIINIVYSHGVSKIN